MARVFSDMNIPVFPEDRTKTKELQKRVQMAFKLGYEIIAINSIVEVEKSEQESEHSENKKQRKKKKSVSSAELIPEPIKIDDLFEDIVSGTIENRKGQLKILNRITLIISDPSHVVHLSSNAVKKYDLVAVQPTTEKVFQLLCGRPEVDIIALDLSVRSAYPMKNQQTKLAIRLGISFEISYFTLIREVSSRRATLTNGQILVDRCKGKNIVISSGARQAIDFRGPYDVASLGLLFGLSEESGKDCVSTNCRGLRLHAEARRLGRSLMSVTPVAEVEPKDSWIVETLSDSEPPEKRRKQK